MSGFENGPVVSLLPEGAAALADLNQPPMATCRLMVGQGDIRHVAIRTTKNAGHLVVLDAYDPPSNGNREPIACFEVDAGGCFDFPLTPPANFNRACLAVFSRTPFPMLNLDPTAYFAGECV